MIKTSSQMRAESIAKGTYGGNKSSTTTTKKYATSSGTSSGPKPLQDQINDLSNESRRIYEQTGKWDTETQKQLHNQAEYLRKALGYSGGADGSQHNSVGSTINGNVALANNPTPIIGSGVNLTPTINEEGNTPISGNTSQIDNSYKKLIDEFACKEVPNSNPDLEQVEESEMNEEIM